MEDTITPDARDVVRLVIHINDDSIKGKTVLQKLAYFTCAKTGSPVSFEPYFYGPFSRDIERGVELLQLSGEIEESVDILGTGSTGWPIRQSRYRLTEDGRKEAQKTEEAHPEFADGVKRLIEEIREEDPSLSPQPLSAAAKVHYLLSSRGEALTPEQIAASAQALGWNLSKSDLDKALRVLERIGKVDFS